RISAEQGTGHRGGGGQVMVEQAAERRPALLLAVLFGSLVGGVGTEQVVQAVTTGPGGLDQVGTGQPVQQAASLPERDAGERGGRIGVELGAGMQSKQPEGARGLVIQV